MNILDGSNTLLASFRWGTSGLISMTLPSGTYAGTYFYAYDGNYNVVALVSGADGSVVARYEYGAFHELIRASGPLALLNPFRAGTKYCDDESGFYYYGYRFYDPSTGRWLSRDPIGERGGPNLYGFANNNALTYIDPLGLDLWDWVTGIQKCYASMCYLKGGLSGLWSGLTGTLGALKDALLSDPIKNANQSLAMAQGLYVLSQYIWDGQFDSLLQRLLPDVHKVLHLPAGSPEFCAALGRLNGKATFDVLLALGTLGLGAELKASATVSREAAAVAEELSTAARAAEKLAATASNFRAKLLQATDDVVGGFVKSDGTFDFVPFTRNGFTGHTDALSAGAIPADAIGGFSVLLKDSKVVGYNFNSVLNGDAVSLSSALQQQVKDALRGF